MRNTKIVATIAGGRCEVDFIRSLYEAGMNVARINTAHVTTETGVKIVKNVRAVSDKIAILIDTKGPEIRTCKLDGDLIVEKGQTIFLTGNSTTSNLQQLCVSYGDFNEDVPVDSQILIDDGDISLKVIDKTPAHLVCEVENDGIIKSNKGINVPGVSIGLPSLSAKDKEFILFAIENNLDFIAHSFVRKKEDVQAIQEILDEHKSPIKIIAKIENYDGINNIDEILEHAYGIMVARGDLGIEIPAEKIPGLQRMLIRKSILNKKPVIIATQMLHSMIDHPRPTRAEVSDVANAIFSRTDAIMLSGETAYGKYPVETIKTMDRIAREAEKERDKRNDLTIPLINQEIPAYLAQSAIRAAKELKTKAIVTTTTTGRTSRYLAAYRSEVPIFAKCHSMRVVREMALSYGVFPSFLEMKKNKFKIEKAAINDLVQSGDIRNDHLIIYVGGRFGEDCGAAFIEVSTVDNLLSDPKENKIIDI